MLLDYVNRDDYEKAFDLGKLLMDHKCSDNRVAALAGVAAYCVNEFDLAEPWLRAASASGHYPPIFQYVRTPDGPAAIRSIRS